MKRALVLMMLCLMVTGCGSLLSFKSTKPPPAPQRDLPSIEHMEEASQVAGWVESALAMMARRGAPPDAPVTLEARRGAQSVVVYLKPPGEPLAAPLSPLDVDPAVTDAIDDLEADNAGRRRTDEEWERDYQDYTTTPVKSGWSIGSGWLRSGLILVVVGLLLFVVVKVGWGLLTAKLRVGSSLGSGLVRVLDTFKQNEPEAFDRTASPALKGYYVGRPQEHALQKEQRVS